MLLAAAFVLSLPLHFEPNVGQAPAATRFVAAAPGYTLYLSDTGVTMQLQHSGAITMKLPRTHVEALDALPGRSNYYAGGDRSAWRTGVPNYDRACYRAVFPGIDLVVYGKTQQIEYDWIVAPGADPTSIHFSFAGASRIRIDHSGDLVLDTSAGEVRHRKPYIYQSDAGRTRQIEGAFVPTRGEVRFRIGAYDKRLPLVIDPKLIFAAGFGGSGIYWDFPMVHYTLNDAGTGIALDKSGNIYVTGITVSADFPQVNSQASSPSAPCSFNCYYRSIFVSKLSPDGATLLYSTYIAAPNGPTISDTPLPGGFALNPTTGAVYVTGGTTGENFPLSGSATTAGGMDAFVVELDTSGSLVASTLIGGTGDDAGTSIALGPDGALYLAGTTQSSNFPTTAGAYQTAPVTSGQNMFLCKLDPAKLTAIYSTYLGPGDSPVAHPDLSGNAYVAANPVTAATPCAASPCGNVVLLKVNPSGSQLVYATSFGGSGSQTLGGLAVDASGYAYIGGGTTSTDLPTTSGVYQTAWHPAAPNSNAYSAAFLAKFDPSAKLIYATYLAGTGYDRADGVTVDSAGNAYLSGSTTSLDFPLVNALQVSPYYYVCNTYTVSGQVSSGQTYCSSAGFLTAFNTDGTALLWSTYLSGAVSDTTLDAAGNVYATGGNLDITTPGIAPSKTASASVLKIAPQGTGLQFSANSIVNAASFHPGLPSPGGLAALFVTGLNVSGTMTAAGYPLPTELAGVTILVQGVPAPILAVADIPGAGYQQINFQVPFEANTQTPNVVEVRYQGSSTFAVPQTVGPGIFLLSDGTPAIQHAADYSLVTASNPARFGETIVVYLTGLGHVSSSSSSPVVSGVPPTSPAPMASGCGLGYMTFGTSLYAGLTPGAVGLYQMNLQLSDSLPSGNLAFSIYWQQCWGPGAPYNYAASNTVNIPIQ
jgi:uncharacterized protein (TIGR03437 family)